MSYSFRDDIAKSLPAGYSIYQIYALTDDTTRVEAIKGSLKTLFKLEKADVGLYFSKIPTITVSPNSTLNDVYKLISDLYGLGLVVNVDYYNDGPINPSSAPLYVELPISNNSHGYKGTLRCYVILDAFTGNNLTVQRDVSKEDITDMVHKLKFRNFLMGSIIDLTGIKFIENSISLEFIERVIQLFSSEVSAVALPYYRSLLSGARVVERYSDGLSDIAVIIANQELYQIRYSDSLKNNGKVDTTSDNSKGLTDGDNESSAENPVGGEGDYNNTEQSEVPYPSSNTEGNYSEEVEIEIE